MTWLHTIRKLLSIRSNPSSYDASQKVPIVGESLLNPVFTNPSTQNTQNAAIPFKRKIKLAGWMSLLVLLLVSFYFFDQRIPQQTSQKTILKQVEESITIAQLTRNTSESIGAQPISTPEQTKITQSILSHPNPPTPVTAADGNFFIPIDLGPLQEKKLLMLDAGQRFRVSDFWDAQENFEHLLQRLNINDTKASKTLQKHPMFVTLSRSRKARWMNFEVDSNNHLLKITSYLPNLKDINPKAWTEVTFEKTSTGAFSAQNQAYLLRTKIEAGEGTIQNSLFGALANSEIDDEIGIQLADIFGGELDFHTDLRKGDQFTVLYESFGVAGYDVKVGKVLAATFVNKNKRIDAALFESKGKSGYYSFEGKSMKRLFLISPMPFSLITSKFSIRRFHPIFKRWRAHLGIDYAAPAGTPIRTVGDGVVTYKGRKGSFGKLIEIKHNARFTTAYAHLNAYGKGIKVGTRVQQGQIIGAVGSTGAATGPHLHFEFRDRGKHVDPAQALTKIPQGPPLSGSLLTEFKQVLQSYQQQFDLLRSSQKLH